MQLRRAVIPFLACALLVPAATRAQDRFADVDAQLRRGEWGLAREAVLPMIAAACTRLEVSELAGPVARLALAEAGLGQEEDAVWHWQVAQNLDRSVLSPEALAAFGPPGEMLARHPLRQRGTVPPGFAVLDAEDSKIRPGRRVGGGIPQLSPAVAALPAPLALRFQILIDREGRPRDPLVLDGGPPGMVWEILEGVRSWRYLPAYQGKKPVAVARVVSVNNPAAPKPASATNPFQHLRASVEAQLRAGKWQEAGELAQTLWEELFRMVSLDLRDVADVLTLRALADAGQGKQTSAVCRWHAAQFLDPGLRNLDLHPYGPAGQILTARRKDGEIPQGSVTIEKQPRFEVPPASRVLTWKGTVTLAATVDGDGALRNPRLLQTENQGQVLLEGLQPVDAATDPRVVFASTILAVSALDAVCDWSVRPSGPAPVQTVLTVPFKATYLKEAIAIRSSVTPAIGVFGSGSRRDPLTPDPSVPPGHTPTRPRPPG